MFAVCSLQPAVADGHWLWQLLWCGGTGMLQVAAPNMGSRHDGAFQSALQHGDEAHMGLLALQQA